MNCKCDTHKDGKYKKWPCGSAYDPLERHRRFLTTKQPCKNCQRLCTGKYCVTCYPSFYLSPLKGKTLPKSWRDAIANGQLKAELSPQWKGEDATYWTKHRTNTKKHGNPPYCKDCGLKGENNKGGKWTIQWANISGNYLRDISDYKGLCSKCHAKFDGKTKDIEDYSHGTPKRYKRGCRCAACKTAKSLYRQGLISF